jgi:hypothetical protein
VIPRPTALRAVGKKTYYCVTCTGCTIIYLYFKELAMNT